MTAAARHDAILRELELRGSLSVARFADHFGVTAMTVRRDLAALERRELLVRVHGGAVSLDVASHQGSAGRTANKRRPMATIGMISPSASYYFPQVIRGAGHAARALNCRLVLGVTNYSEREELRQAERLVRGGGIDAVMITPSVALAEGTPLHSLLVEASLPVVLVERAVGEGEGGRLDSVRSDHAYGAALAVEHLAGLGHRRIAAAVRDAPTSAGIMAGYDRTLDRMGLAAGRMHWRLPSPESGDDATTASLERFLDECLRLGVSAALVLGDVDAVALTDIALHRGIRVPEDLAIVAYDDEVARYAVVPLTAVAPAKHELGYAAVKLCVDRLRRDEGDAHAVTRLALMPKLIERESTRVRRTCGGPAASRP